MARNVYESNLTADYAAITPMASCAMANLYKAIRFNDRDKFAEGAF